MNGSDCPADTHGPAREPRVPPDFAVVNPLLTQISHPLDMSTSPLSFLPVAVALALHLTGCAAPLSPEAACFARATVDYRAAWRAAEAIRADLVRGYALHQEEIRVPEAVPCRQDGVLTTCLQQGRATRALPVAIDRAHLQHRLAALKARMDALRPAAMERAAPCGYGDLAGAG